MSDKLIEVWYHKVMNEKSIHAPFVPEQQKFCSARKPSVAGCPMDVGRNCATIQKPKRMNGKMEKWLKMPQKAVQ